MTPVRIEHILCPVDFSDFSRHAIDHALAIGRCWKATLTALHVLPPRVTVPPFEHVMYPSSLSRTEAEVEQARRQLAKFVAQEGGGPAVDRVVVEGYVAGEILRYATSRPADLVVMGTHGRSGFQRLMLGSVAENVLRHSKVPVLTVPPKMPDAVPVGPELFAKILCAVDFSTASLQGLDYAISLATLCRGELHVVHVVPPVTDFVTAAVGGVDVATMRAAAQTQLHDVLIKRLDTSMALNEVVSTGDPSQEILRAADEHDVNVLVLGVAERGGLGMTFFGSTANHVVRRATRPVLTVRG